MITSRVLVGCVLLLAWPRVFLAQTLPPAVDLDVPNAPMPVRADGKVELVYEVHVTNLRPQPLELTGVEIYADDGSTKPLASYTDADLEGMLARPGAPADLPNKRLIAGGMRAVVFLQLIFDTDASLPRSLHHSLHFKPDGVVEGAGVVIQRSSPFVITAPLRGDSWLAANSISNVSVHRRALIPVDGKARIAQRFATDWIKLGTDGLPVHGDPAKNASWDGYGAEILAVASGRVAAVKDGLPENVPLSAERVVPITLGTLGGNFVLLDLGNGNSAFYGHMQPGSVRVKVGDKVRPGQVLGLLGNSGNSDVPHLHFHVADRLSPFAAEGIPCVLDSFDQRGAVKSLDALLRGESWKPEPTTATDHRHRETPVENAVVNFP